MAGSPAPWQAAPGGWAHNPEGTLQPKIIRRAALGLVAAAPLALGLLATTGASAAPMPSPHDSTAGCQASSSGCAEPVVAVSQTSGTDFVPANDAAMTVQPTRQVFTRQNNALDNGSQDFDLVTIGHVPFFGAGSYGFTSFDRSHWAGRPIVQAEWTPFGSDSGWCVNIGRNSQLGNLAPCGTGGGQAFILSHNVPGVNAPGVLNYTFVINVRQANLLARHRLLTASDTGFGQVSDSRAINHSPGVATAQMWSSLP